MKKENGLFADKIILHRKSKIMYQKVTRANEQIQ